MNKIKITNILLYKTAVLFSLILLFSCDTEYIDKVNEIPGDVIQVSGYNQIESFIVKDTENNTINAAITEDKIIITWSNFMELPKTIKPEIILGTDATVSPASGAEVEFKDGAVYTVTSKAGTTKQYTLKIDLRQQEPSLWQGYEETLYKGTLQNKINVARSGSVQIDYLLLNINETRVYFVAETDQKEYTAETVYVGSGTGTSPFNYYGIYYFLPEDMPLGKYDLRIKNGAYTLKGIGTENSYQLTIEDADYFSTTLYGSPAQKVVGENVEVRGTLMNTVTSVQIYKSTASTVTYPLEIVSQTPYRCVLKLPEGVPAGTYNRMRFYRGTTSSLSSYTVTVK